MKTSSKVSFFLTAVVMWAGYSAPVLATTIFDNSVNVLVHRFNPGTVEVGDQIKLASTERFLTNFSFEYWGTNTAMPDNSTFAGSVEAKIKFYKNDGAPFNGYATPDHAFFESAWFPITIPTARDTFYFTVEYGDFPSGGLLIPVDEMTWSVQFQGMGLTDTVGLDIYSPPVVGQEYPDYWANNPIGGWTLLTNGVPMNFGARLEATIPEPSALMLSIFGGLGILTLARRLRQKE